jgi:hypothetical protein
MADTRTARYMTPEEFVATVQEHRRRTGNPHPLIRLARALERQKALSVHERQLAETRGARTLDDDDLFDHHR